MEKNLKNYTHTHTHTYTCVTESLCCTLETNTHYKSTRLQLTRKRKKQGPKGVSPVAQW